jgi:hypothetical protein
VLPPTSRDAGSKVQGGALAPSGNFDLMYFSYLMIYQIKQKFNEDKIKPHVVPTVLVKVYLKILIKQQLCCCLIQH